MHFWYFIYVSEVCLGSLFVIATAHISGLSEDEADIDGFMSHSHPAPAQYAYYSRLEVPFLLTAAALHPSLLSFIIR